MLYTTTFALSLLSCVAASSHSKGQQQANNCSDIHIITARASTEPPGEGIIGTLATLIQNSNQGVTRDSVQYPATFQNYAISSAMGTSQLTKQLTAYTKDCPSVKVVLLGYSQGAHVLGDTMCGGGEARGLGPTTPPIDTAVGEKVVALIQMGDPRALVNQTQDVGNATKNGVFPRQPNQLCTAIAPKIQSFCDEGDPFCASGPDINVHLGYTQEYNSRALTFVNDRLKSASTSTPASASASASGKPSSTTTNSEASSSPSSTNDGASRAVHKGLIGAGVLLGLSLCL